MSTTNFRTTSLTNTRGLKQILTNKNVSNLQSTKNVIKPTNGLTKKMALSSSTNLVNNTNNDSKLINAKPSANNLLNKKQLVSITENENIENTKKPIDSKLCSKKSKIPKILSPIKTTSAPKQLKKDITSTINSTINKQQPKIIKQQPILKESNIIRFSSFIIPDNIENIDLNDNSNVLLAPGFVNDIYVYLNYLEEKFKLKSNFLQIQQQINYKMRARLIDWMVAIHHKFKLLAETLYLAVAIMDRFLEKVNIAKEKVQLVGLTAFFIACKYEEIYPPEIDDFLKVCDAYSKNDILKMEKTILKTLDFKLSYALPLHFLRRFSKAAHADQEIHTLAKYIMELGLMEYECSSWKPSLLAAASLYLTLHILAGGDKKSQWTDSLAFYSNYKEDDLQKEVSYLSKVILKQKDSKLQATKQKYSNARLLSVSEDEKLNSEYVVRMSKKFD